VSVKCQPTSVVAAARPAATAGFAPSSAERSDSTSPVSWTVTSATPAGW
jgi:hypothetical protein